MKFEKPDTIAKYVKIAMLGQRKVDFFPPGGGGGEALACGRFTELAGNSLTIELTPPPASLEGEVTFFSFSFRFGFEAELRTGSRPGEYHMLLPAEIFSKDRRQFPRLCVERNERKLAHLFHPTSGVSCELPLRDISAGGMAFEDREGRFSVHGGDAVRIEVELLYKTIRTMATVISHHGDLVGCQFDNRNAKFQRELNSVICNEIEWRSEFLLTQLERCREQRQPERPASVEAGAGSQLPSYLELANPLLETAVEVLDTLLTVNLQKRSVKMERIASGMYDASVNLACRGGGNRFQFFLCFTHPVLEALLRHLREKGGEEEELEVATALQKIGGVIADNTRLSLEGVSDLHISAPSVIVGSRYVLSTLSRVPSLRIIFDSEAGPFDMVLFLDQLKEMGVEKKCAPLPEISLDQVNLMEPIAIAAENLFRNHLRLEVKEKSVSLHAPLLPKFEASGILDVSGGGVEGKVVLNLTTKLACALFQRLVGEEETDFTPAVQDALGEVVNMICGNAKAEFAKRGIYYKLSTPFIIVGRDQMIATLGEKPFLTSFYWTNEGLFELSFSLYRTGNVAPAG